MQHDLAARVAQLERAHRRLKALTTAVLFALAAFGATWYSAGSVTAQSDESPQELTVSQLNVVDANGVVRMRLGADLPDGVIQGRKTTRGHAFAGILLYDDDGQERSGYGTMGAGNVGLTLDTRHLQSASFVAGPSNGAALRLWDGDDAVDLRVDENGPGVHATRDGQVAFHEPAIDDPENAPFCRSYRDLAARVSMEDLWEACRKRRAESSCQACLGSLE